MLDVATAIHVALRRRRSLPEDEAARVGIDAAKFDRILVGRELDWSFRDAFELARDLNCQLSIQFILPPTPQRGT
jgi:hypothetical protein